MFAVADLNLLTSACGVMRSSRRKAIAAIILASSTITAFAADPTPLTFTRDIAPVVFRHCAPCHAPGGVRPFHLLTYEDIRRHAKQITATGTTRVMPPWLPEPR